MNGVHKANDGLLIRLEIHSDVGADCDEYLPKALGIRRIAIEGTDVVADLGARKGNQGVDGKREAKTLWPAGGHEGTAQSGGGGAGRHPLFVDSPAEWDFLIVARRNDQPALADFGRRHVELRPAFI